MSLLKRTTSAQIASFRLSPTRLREHERDGSSHSRTSYAITVAERAQARLLANAAASGALDLVNVPDQVIDRLIGEGDEVAVGVDSWDFPPVPLIVAHDGEEWSRRGGTCR